ncbi:MAG TPA: hypothetical protein VLL25_11000, partial [Acidimicrobiales bacterium]|nr:hypothetical protein [Acidimicrobiales bacterium]
DRHWTDVVLAAAQTGDPYAYGRDRLEHVYRTLVEQTRTPSPDRTAERQMADLERAVVGARPARTVRPRSAQERALASAHHRTPATPGHDLYRGDAERELAIGL